MDSTTQPAKEIFLAAIEKATAAERAAYLDQACGDDAELRQRVEALLRAHDESQNPLERPAVALAATVTTGHESEQAGARIGPYKLLQQIGEGGMGVVYMAEQQRPVKRRVAIKIIKPGMDSAQVIARFEAERQALAMMDHPNIAKVLDAGATDSGRPFFVMELVYGMPITKFCDDHRLTPRQRLELIVPVCQAVQHAHGRGIIHRDLKPSNILVAPHDGRPVVKVIDFGIAKAIGQQLTDKTIYTRFMQMVGTPLYMSPEQAEVNALDVDIRSDVYGLGVLLYELLTGTTPFDRRRFATAAHDEIRRIIKEEDPPKPSTRLSTLGERLSKVSNQRKTEPAKLSALVKGDLDWIVMKALEKDRQRRYETASALARDVERHLRNEAVEACPPSAAYRLRKFARRNRALLFTGAAFLALLSTAVVVSTYLAVDATNAKRSADAQRDKAEESERQAALDRDRAQREWRRAEDAAKEARANAAETERALDRVTVAKGIDFAAENDSYAALSLFVKPLGRAGLTNEEERMHRARVACHFRHSPGRLVLRQVFDVGGPVQLAAWNARARRILTVCNKVVQVWDVFDGESIATLRHDDDVVTAQFTPDGDTVVAATNTDFFTWNVGTGQRTGFSLDAGSLQRPISAENLSNPVDVVVSRDSGRVLVRGPRASRVVERLTGTLIGEWPQGNDIHRDALSPDGERILLIRDGLASVHHVPTDPGAVLALDHGGPVAHVAFSQDGNRALTRGDDRQVQIWDTSDWHRLVRIDTRDRWSERFSPDGRRIACWSYSLGGPEALACYDAESGQLLREIPDVEYDLEGSFDQPLFDWLPSGQRLLRVSKRREISFWDLSSPSNHAVFLPFAARLTSAVYAPDGLLLLTATDDGEVRIWDMDDGDQPFGLQPRAPGELSTCIPIKRTTNEGGRSYEHFDEFLGSMWSFQSRIRPLLPPATAFADGAVSPGRSRVLTVSDDCRELQLWDSRTRVRLGKPLRSNSCFNWSAFSADSRFMVAACDDGAAHVIDVDAPDALERSLNHGAPVLYAAFRPDGNVVVTCGEDATARLWDALTCEPVAEPLQHERTVILAAFSVDGKTLATASLDGTVRLWDESGRSLGVLDLRGVRAAGLMFHPDGALLVADGEKLVLWDVASQLQLGPPMVEAEIDDFYKWWNRMWELPRRTCDAMTGPIFDLPLDERPAADLAKMCLLYSGRRYEASGNSVPLGKDERQALWRELLARFPDEFGFSDERQARGLVRFHLRHATSEADLRQRIAGDKTAATEPRTLAQALAAESWAKAAEERAKALNEKSWDIVARPGAGVAAYSEALTWAELACQLTPENGNYVNTLGVAQYRVGQFESALATLARSLLLNTEDGDPHPSDVAFLAMTQQALGNAEEANELLAQLRDLATKPKWKAETKQFLPEAEERIGGQAGDSSKGPE